MPWTDFNPKLNGFFGSHTALLSGFRHRTSQAIIREACSQVLAELEQSYFGGVEAYNVTFHLETWAREPQLEVCGSDSGKIFTILDYYNAGLYLPKTIQRFDPRQREAFQRYFWQRSLDNLRANLSPMIKALAITAFLPDEWYPQTLLDTQIKQKLKRLRIYRDISITADLGLAPGGLDWMAHATRSAVTLLKERLEARRPWPVRMVLDANHLCANRQVIAYDLNVNPGPVLQFKVYEPDCICAEHAIRISLEKERPAVLEICSHDAPVKLAGLICEAYQHTVPPSKCLTAVQRHEPTRKVSWHLRRWFQ
jgi:hypothetical protein